MFWFGRKRKPQEPLPPVIAPEVVGKGQGRYLDRVLDESRRVLDAPLSSFRELESFSSSRDGTSWSVHTRPVEGTKVGVGPQTQTAQAHARATAQAAPPPALNTRSARHLILSQRLHPPRACPPAHSLHHTHS